MEFLRGSAIFVLDWVLAGSVRARDVGSHERKHDWELSEKEGSTGMARAGVGKKEGVEERAQRKRGQLCGEKAGW